MASSRNFVIDFQGFKPKGHRRFIVKEISLYGVDNVNFSANFVVKPPLGCSLPPGVLEYVRDNIHGIEWQHGHISFHNCLQIIRDVCCNATCVFVKGSERVKFVREIIFENKVPVADLDKCGCPKYDEKQYTDEPSCFYRYHLDEFRKMVKVFSCALKKAWFYTCWLDEMMRFKCQNRSTDDVECDENDGPTPVLQTECSIPETTIIAALYEEEFLKLSTLFNTRQNGLVNEEKDEFIEFTEEDEFTEFTYADKDEDMESL